MAISTQPYFIRALYEWCLDSAYTPYLAVWVNEYTRVPMQFVDKETQQIVLSISENAVRDLQIDNEWISFSARFGGVAQEVWIPITHVMSIFAKETGEGMGFEVEPYLPENAVDTKQPESSLLSQEQKIVELSQENKEKTSRFKVIS